MVNMDVTVSAVEEALDSAHHVSASLAALGKRPDSKEAKLRAEMRMSVVTNPSSPFAINDYVYRPSAKRPTLPSTATAFLTELYEALIMCKNCELPTRVFWSRYDVSGSQCVDYTPEGIQDVLATVGVECNTKKEDTGETISTGRWILLRHGHFLLRAQHTIDWLPNKQPKALPSTDARSIEDRARAQAPVVWDWKSGAEKWRWQMWQSSHAS